MKARWTLLWPWLAVIAILALARVPAFYLSSQEADALVIFEEDADAEQALAATVPIGR